VVYGYLEGGNDRNELMDMFEYLRCRCDVVYHTRIGRAVSGRHDLTGRPIKVELKSSSEANSIIANAKYLRDEPYYHTVYVSK
jgi:hypothetical protein